MPPANIGQSFRKYRSRFEQLSAGNYKRIMCGICGILKRRGDPVDERILTSMRDTMVHRGPDGAGNYVAGHLGLGHRRLKIIDLSEAAAQPMFNEDRTIAVVFNGEIYNFQELRRELQSHGHQFRSQSDTEVILHGYEQWGTACVERFNGMFAFAVYDSQRDRLWLVRDRLGIKPLYYWQTPTQFAFASEIHAFMALPAFRAEINPRSVAQHLLFRNRAGETTILKEVLSVAPGHWLMVSPDLTTTDRSYWELNPDQPEPSGDWQAQAEELLRLLEESVALQEISDVPIGVQLSGGTDSSMVTALMARRTGRALRSFSVGFDEKGYSELPYAHVVSETYRTEHHEIILTNHDFTTGLQEISARREEPLLHANSAGLHAVCRLAKPIATVLLTGEGADEVFGGYYRYVTLSKSFTARRWLPENLKSWRLLSATTQLRSLRNALTMRPSDLIIDSTAQNRPLQESPWLAHFAPELWEERQETFESYASQDWLTQALYYDLKTYLPPLLMRQDTMSMAHGVETRVPFLDHRVVELGFSLPTNAKVKGRQSKRLLKEVAHRFLPAKVLDRPKIGFGFPLEPWMRASNGLGQWLEAITEPNSFCCRVLPRANIAAYAEAHRKQLSNHTDLLWSLIALEAWHRGFFSSPTPKPSIDVSPYTPQATADGKVLSIDPSQTVVGGRQQQIKHSIAHIVLSLKVGGLERVVVYLAQQFRQSGHPVLVCCLDERGEFADQLSASGIPVILVRRPDGIGLKTMWHLAKILRDREIQIVHTHNPSAHLHGVIAGLLAGVHVRVHTRHGRNYPDDRRKILLNHMLSWVSSRIVAVSDDALAVARDVERISEHKLLRIWNGIDLEPYLRKASDQQAQVLESGSAATTPVIGSVGRLSKEKDYGTMLQAFRLVLEHEPKAQLWLVGDGPAANDLRRQAAELGLTGKAHFVGQRLNIAELLQKFTLFSLSSTTEGLSMTLIEAMASGVPIVATDVGGNREVINPPECGIVVPPSNPQALADAYLSLIRDSTQREKMRMAGPVRARNYFSMEKMAHDYDDLYRALAMRR